MFALNKVFHIIKNLFCNVLQNCNLAIEFNGLVSKRVSRNADPFMFLEVIGTEKMNEHF
jgi:hypothetical protein